MSGDASRCVNSEQILEGQLRGGLRKDDVFSSDICIFIFFFEVRFSGNVFPFNGNREGCLGGSVG